MHCAGKAARHGGARRGGEGGGRYKNRPDRDTCACGAWYGWGLKVGVLKSGEMRCLGICGVKLKSCPRLQTQVGAEQDSGVSVAATLNWALPVCTERRAR